MKILTQKSIIDGFHFPLSEAIIFSLLLWCSWGLAESLYWEKIVRFLDPATNPVTRTIYLEALAVYLLFASFLAFISYYGIKILLLWSSHYNPHKFRGMTLAFILVSFFSAGFVYGYEFVIESSFSPTLRASILAGIVIFSAGCTIVLYRWSSGLAFRIRRSGTMMFSILALSAVLSVVRFPVFSAENPKQGEARPVPGKGYEKLMLYVLLEPLIVNEKEGS